MTFTPAHRTALDTFLTDLLRGHAEEAIAFRRQLHMHPELSRQEFATTTAISTRLEVAGLPVRVHPADRGLLCDIAQTADGPLVVLRADIDALPLPDTKTVSYASRVPGVTHACGHDVHTTIVLGAGIALEALRRARETNPDLPALGPVRLLFQPSEEKAPGGARDMIDFGAIEGAAAIMALHCDPTLEVGKIGILEGPVTSAVDLVEVVLRGPGGHTARPHLTVNLLEATGRALLDLPARVAERLPSPDGHVRLVFGTIEGGHAANVIPTEVRMLGTFRTLHRDAWEQAPGVIQAAAEEVLADYPVQVEVNHGQGAPPVINDAEVTQVLRRAAQAAFADAVAATEPSLGGEDFSFYLDHLPGSYARLGVSTPGAQQPPALHTSMFDVDERAIAVGIRLLVYAVLQAQSDLVG